MDTIYSPAEPRRADQLSLMIFLAAVVHGIIILGVSFAPILQETQAPPALDVILIPKNNREKPEEAEFLAQTSQDGGGDTERSVRQSSPFASSEDFDTNGIAPTPMEASSPKASKKTPDRVLTTLFSERKESEQQEQELQPENTTKQAEIYIERSMEIAKLSAEINQQIEEYNKRPRKTFLTARTQEAIAAEYMFHWVEKVEAVGNLNYPEAARLKNLEGTLILVVGIRQNGSIEEVLLKKTSGHKVLDDAAKRIVTLAAPYPPLTGALAETTDILYITRTWEFKQNASKLSP